MAGKEQDSDFDKVGDAFIIESPKAKARFKQVGGGRPPLPPPGAASMQKQYKSAVVDGKSLKLETSENRMERQLPDHCPECLNIFFLTRGKKLGKKGIERVKRIWLMKEEDEDERRKRLGGIFCLPPEEILECDHLFAFETGKKRRADGNRVNAKNAVESQHAESNESRPQVEGTHKVGRQDFAPAPNYEVTTSEGSSNQAAQILVSTI